MKKILTILLLLISVFNAPALELKKEWRQYTNLARRDRPQDQIEKLHAIREIALERRLPDDLFDACREEQRIYSRLNWKSQDSLAVALREVIESYGEPLLTYLWLDKDFLYALLHQTELESGYHPELQRRKISFLQTKDVDEITSDMEWLLWDRLTSSSYADSFSDEYALLLKLIGDRYPSKPYLLYLAANKPENRLEAMQALVKRYADDPFHFIPEKVTLEERMSRIRNNPCPTEAECIVLYNDVKAFSKAAKAQKGIHQRLNLNVDHIEQALERHQMDISFQNDSIVLTGRNIGRGTVVFSSDEATKIVSFRNQDGPFYVLDTLRAPIPALPDGSYRVRSEKYASYTSYQKHTLSLAVRRQKEGFAVYVADYQTGEPVPSATIRLKRRRKTIEKELSLDGFTLLPEVFQKLIDKREVTLEARIGDRRSAMVALFREAEYREDSPGLMHARVFKDRGAFKPGDTLKMKAVLFEGDLADQVKTLQEGREVQIQIYNVERRIMADMVLRTNAFGSIALAWPIPIGERNGLWSIEVSCQKKMIERTQFRVEDFVLPTFEVTFDPQEGPFLPEKDFEVEGKVVTYSGHPVGGIALEGTVTRFGREYWKGPIALDKDGVFKVPLNLPMTGEFLLKVKAVDATGETREFEHNIYLSSGVVLNVEMENVGDGDFSIHGIKLENALLTGAVGRFVWTVKSGNTTLRMPVDYRLTDTNGNTLREGTSDEILELDMTDCPDGLYYLHGTVEAGERNGMVDMPVLKMTSVMAAPVRSVFLPNDTEVKHGESIRAGLGAGSGPLWAVATLAAPDGAILESRMVHLDGMPGRADSLTELKFDYKDNYPNVVRLEVFYFRDAEQVTHEAVYRRVRRVLDLPLSFSRFVDQAMPGASCNIELQTEPGVEAAVAIFDKSLDAVNANVWTEVKAQEPALRKGWFQSVAGRITGEILRNLGGDSGFVSGVILDYLGEPLIGASIEAEGTGFRTLTDLDGKFSFDVPVGTPLRISYIGYQTLSVPAYSGMQIILEEDNEFLEEIVVIGYGVSSALSGKAAGVQVRGYSKSDFDVAEEEEPEIVYRAVFSEALAFEPFLYSDESGKVDVPFQTSDKISTYHVNVFAHDRSMRNGVLQRDIVVTIPVRVAVTPPRYLYEGDEYELSALVSSVADEDVEGRLYLQVEAGEDGRPLQVADVTVPAGGSASAVFTVGSAIATAQPLDLRVVFESGNFSDGIRLSVPVYPAVQTLTESHSALAGRESVDSLRRMFVNVPGEQAEVTMRTLREVVEEGLAQWTASDNPDALSMSADFYARALLNRDTTGILAPLMALRQQDGGFAWMDGMDSSPVVTATLLERFAALRDKGIPIPDMESSVRYLDNTQFGNWMPMWCGGLSDEEYMDIRAMWTSIPFNLNGVESKVVRRFRLSDFRRFARRYLTPGRYDYANGWILDKARRVRTLQNLLASAEGIELALDWGEVVLTTARFENSIKNDLISLEQYAVPHPSGGMYYPNAVLPFKGLLSSEVYAHTLLSGLMEGPVADGVKLWLILQNETQSWIEDPAYIDALQVLLSAPDNLLDKQIVSLTGSVEVPFEDIKASGNGMRIEKQFFKEKDGIRTEIQPDDILQVGDRVITRYELWSAENRSFVRVDAFREANLLPVEQRSGPLGGDERDVIFRSVRIDGLWARRPQFYRDVREERTSWWIDVCPEESSVWEEACFVTQAGTFTAPVITVESLYSPEYRANSPFRGSLHSE